MRLLTAVVLTTVIGLGLLCADDRTSLAGLGRLTVLLDVNNGDNETPIAKVGLTADQLRTDAELRLRKAGVSVVDYEQYLDLTIKESRQLPDIGVLFLSVTALCDPAACFYTVRPSLSQPVALLRDATRVVQAATWNGGGRVGIIRQAPPKAATEIRSAVGDCVDDFLNKYLAANPPKR